MATQIGTERDPVTMLEHLLSLEYDAIEAYQAAIDRLDNDEYVTALQGFKKDHERHLQELEPAIRTLGGTPPDGPGAKSMLTTGKVKLAGMMGDEAILRAMKTNEEDTNTAYERAQAQAPAEVADVIRRARDDERRHWEWIASTLEGRPVHRETKSSPRHHGAPPPRS